MKNTFILIIIAALLLAMAFAAKPEKREKEYMSQSYAGKQKAPEFPAGLDWLNTDHPLSIAELKGKVVLLDFWTYGCVNCMHIIPDLKKLEEKYAQELVVIGVHSAKFENEGSTKNIRNIILRYGLKHPVINDKDFKVWRSYGARAWPTLVLIDPLGKVVGKHSGEGIYDIFDKAIAGVIAEFDAQGLIKRGVEEFGLEQISAQTPLLFPGKVLADNTLKRLFIADTNHNRIVVTDFDGNVLELIGSGQEGLEDGGFSQAAFNKPQGLTLADSTTLYVADTENHAIRKIDLKSRTVETVAGNGSQEYLRLQKVKAKDTGLNTPWDVLFDDGVLYIAMAGQHQLWSYNPKTKMLTAFAGSGREELRDGPLLQAGLNQPSGLAADGKRIYFADSEASAIRTADKNRGGKVTTLVGTGLFDFGDKDGKGDGVRLQHPLAVDYDNSQKLIYIADTYNSKIKTLDPETREVKSVFGSSAGWQDDYGLAAKLYEPGGLSIAGSKLFIADTNNHVIRMANLETGELKTIVLNDKDGLLTANASDNNVLSLAAQKVAAGWQKVTVMVNLPKGYKFNSIAPFSMSWQSTTDRARIADNAFQTIIEPEFPLEFDLFLKTGKTVLKGDLNVYYCDYETLGLCLLEPIQIELPLIIDDDSNGQIQIEYTIPKPKDFNSL